MALFGHDLRDMTDEEVEAGVVELGRKLGSVGYSAAEAAEAMHDLARAVWPDEPRA